MGDQSSQIIYNFDGFFFTFFKIKFLERKASNGSLELRNIKMMFLATAGSLIQVLASWMGVVQFLKAKEFELVEICEAGGIGGVFLITFCRGIAFLVNQREVNIILKNLEGLFPIIRRQLLKDYLQRSAKRTILRNKIMNSLYSYGSVAFLILPILQSSYKRTVRDESYVYRYPFIAWYPFDTTSLLAYSCVYCFQIAMCFSGVLFLFNEDLIFSTAVTLISMHYQYLSELVIKLDARVESINGQKLKPIIQYQYVIESLANDVNIIFSSSTFFSFTIMKITLCMLIFAMFHGTDIPNMIRLSLGILALIVPVQLRCFNGTDLYEASERLLDSLYQHNWYEGTPQHRKTIVMMMARANRPVELQASKINHICVGYFKEIVMQTYQFIMFLYNFSN